MSENYEDEFEFEDDDQPNKKHNHYDSFQQDQKNKHDNKQQQKSMRKKSKKKVEESNDYYDEDFEGDNHEDANYRKAGRQKTKSQNKRQLDQSVRHQGKSLHLDNAPINQFKNEVAHKFPDSIDLQSLTNDKLNKFNELVRETIKKYSEHLDLIIMKNMSDYNKRQKVKKVDVEEERKVLKEEIKNNQKYAQRLENQLQKLKINQFKYQKHEEQEMKYHVPNYKRDDLLLSIKEKQKEIHQLKLDISNDSKKLTNNYKVVFTDREIIPISEEYSMQKKTYLTFQQEYEKNEEKIENLNERENWLNNKGKQMEEKERKYAQIIERDEKQLKTHKKYRKYLQVKKKVDNARNYYNKTILLWEAKSKVSEHENQQIRIKLKNMDAQIKNLQQSVTQEYDKSMKTIEKVNSKNQKKKINQTTLKALERIKENMKVYQQNEQVIMRRSISRSQFGKLPISKKSSSTLDIEAKKLSLNEKKLGDEKEERVWQKQQGNQEKENVERRKITVKNEEQQKTFQLPIEEKKQQEVKEKQNKKPFTLRKNRTQSENKFHQTEIRGQQQKNNDQKELNKGEEEQKQLNIPSFAPKRFNLRNKNSHTKREQSYIPSVSIQNENEKKPEVTEKNDGNTSTSKPSFNLRKKKQNVKQKQEQLQNIDNQFMKDSDNSNPYLPTH